MPFAVRAETAPAALPAPAATAQPALVTDADKGKRWQACATDIANFCATVEKGKGMMRACLDSHGKELYDGCKTARAGHAAKEKDKDKGAK